MTQNKYLLLIILALLIFSTAVVAGGSSANTESERQETVNTGPTLQSVSIQVGDTTLQHEQRTTLSFVARQSQAGETVEITGDIRIPEGVILIDDRNPNQAYTQTAQVNLTVTPGSVESERYQIALLRQEEKRYTFTADFILEGQEGETNRISGLSSSVEQIEPTPRLLPQLTTRSPATEVGSSLSQIRIFSMVLLMISLPGLLYEVDRKLYPGPDQHLFGILATGVTFATFAGQVTFVASYSVSVYVWPTLILLSSYAYINRLRLDFPSLVTQFK
jgi:hypothetical protein